MDLSKNVTESEESEFTFSNFSKKLIILGTDFEFHDTPKFQHHQLIMMVSQM